MSAARSPAAARSPVKGYLRFLAWASLIGVAALLLGYAPTRRLWGEAAIPAMMAGVAIGVIASAAGALPIALSRMRGAPISPTQGLAAMGIRTAAVVVL